MNSTACGQLFCLFALQMQKSHRFHSRLQWDLPASGEQKHWECRVYTFCVTSRSLISPIIWKCLSMTGSHFKTKQTVKSATLQYWSSCIKYLWWYVPVFPLSTCHLFLFLVKRRDTWWHGGNWNTSLKYFICEAYNDSHKRFTDGIQLIVVGSLTTTPTFFFTGWVFGGGRFKVEKMLNLQGKETLWWWFFIYHTKTLVWKKAV